MNDVGGVRPGQRLVDLPADHLGVVVLHPAHVRNVARVEVLVAALDRLATAEEYGRYQGELFADVHDAQQRWSECIGAAKRVRAGKAPHDGVSPPAHTMKSGDAEAWQLEALVYERISRQLRAVGDGLAWRAFGYDRAAIVALSRNQGSGPMFGKRGLPYELGAVEALWDSNGHFALLHDLTNCLRIGDITEMTARGERLIHEVKASRTAGTRQSERMRSAVAAVMNGQALPGSSTARLVRVSTRHNTDISALGDVLRLAELHGCRGMKLRDGRAVVATDVAAMHARFGPDSEAGLLLMASTRERALARAGMSTARHQIRGTSGDTASRSAAMAPFAIYPFSPNMRAKLICDLLVFETVLDPDALVSVCLRSGLSGGTVALPLSNGQTRPEADVVRVSLGDRRLTLHGEGLTPLLFELVTPTAWASAVREVLLMPDAPIEPMLIFSDEGRSFVKAHPPHVGTSGT